MEQFRDLLQLGRPGSRKKKITLKFPLEMSSWAANLNIPTLDFRLDEDKIFWKDLLKIMSETVKMTSLDLALISILDGFYFQGPKNTIFK